MPLTALRSPTWRRLRCLGVLTLLWLGQGQSISPQRIPSRPQDSVTPPGTVAGTASTFESYPYISSGKPRPAPQPGERVLLTLENGTQKLTLTRSQLLALPSLRYKTTQLQLQRSFTYDGVPLRDLAKLGGFAGKALRIYASNGFVTTIPASEYLNAAIMLAHTANGAPIPVLQKGPLEVVLPPEPRFAAKKYGSYWVWFVTRITPAP